MYTPAAAKTSRMAMRLFRIGVRRPFSKSRTVLRATLARFAKSSWLQSNQPRAARLCSGESIPET